MVITFERFMELVPEDTKHFTKDLLRYLENYGDKEYIRIDDTIHATTREEKAFVILLSRLEEESKYSVFLNQNGISLKNYPIYQTTYAIDTKKAFNNWSFLFTSFKDESKYKPLTPMAILLSLMENNTFPFIKILSSGMSFNNFKDKVYNFRINEYQNMTQEVEKRIYKNLPITCISYLETATKIREVLIEKASYSHSNDFLKNTEEDITSLSMLLALYYYQDVKIDDQYDITEQQILTTILKEQQIEVKDIWIKLGILEISKEKIYGERKNVFAIENSYQSYYTNEELTVSKMINILFSKDNTDSTAVKKLLTSLGCNIKLLDFSEERIKNKVEEIKRNKDFQYVKKFYEGLSKETIDFLEFATKAYILLLTKMEQRLHNKEILFQEDDADTLALYIANCYYHGKINEFYLDYGVSLQKVLKLVGIELNKEEIESTELNSKVLVERFKRFVYEGENKDKKPSQINIENISYNLCNRTFNKSMIMENIFFELTGKQVLESDFLSTIKEHMTNKEKLRIQQLSQKLFKDMPQETIQFLENVSKIHTKLRKRKKDWNSKDLKVVALLLGTLKTSEDKIAEFYKDLGFSVKGICAFFNIEDNDFLSNVKIDIDLLSKEYAPFIFGGENKNKKRCELTILNISKNIFSKELNNSVVISRLFGQINKTYDDFTDIDTLYNNYLQRLEKEQEEREITRILDRKEDCKTYMINTIKIHSRILKEIENDNYNKELIQREKDIIKLSLLLGLFTVENKIKTILEEKKITLETILSYMQLPKEIIYNLNNIELDRKLLLNIYIKYFECDNSYSPYDNSYRIYSDDSISKLAKKTFDENLNDSTILQQLIEYFRLSYQALKSAIEEEKPYETFLTVDEKISWLNNETIDTLNLYSMESILKFGMNLTTHSKYIDEKFPALILSDTHENSIATINTILEKVHEKETDSKKKKGFFAKFIVSEKEETKTTINYSAIEELTKAINKNIKNLSKELLKYDEIRKYLDAYRKKNNQYLGLITKAKEEVKHKLMLLKPDEEDDFSEYLTASSIFKIMEDKENRFQTTNHLRKQELVKVNQMIVQHFITINALEMARDDLLPLIVSEQAFLDGKTTENQALSISQNIINLFQALLTRNLETAEVNLENLKKSTLPEEILLLLNNDVEQYINDIKQMTIFNDMITENTTNEEKKISSQFCLEPEREDSGFKKYLTLRKG